MRQIDFGHYETTTRTVWRHAREQFRPSFVLDDALRQDLQSLEDAERELSFLSADEQISRKVQEITLEENIFSTLRLSGLEVTLDEVRNVVARRPAVRVEGGRAEREMLNMATAIDRLPDRQMPSSIQDVASIHAELLSGVDPDAGRLRESATFEPGEGRDEVGFVPAMPDRVRPELNALVEWLNTTDEPPAVRAAIAMHEVQSMQPFLRGNARLARFLGQVVMYHSGCRAVRYVLLDHGFYRTQQQYRQALLDVERQRDHTPWIRYHAMVAAEAYQDGVRRFLLHQRSDGELNERQWRVAEWFARRDRERVGRRHRFSEVHAAFPDIPERTLQRDLATLRDGGILSMEGKWKGARYVYVDRLS